MDSNDSPAQAGAPGADPNPADGRSVAAPRKRRLAPILVMALATLGIGAVFYRSVEDFTWLDSFYFCVMMLTTVGYDNVEVVTTAGKIFTIFYAIFGVVILAAAASYILRQALDRHLLSREHLTEHHLLHRHPRHHDD